MRLPGGGDARIDPHKIRGYLLSRTHPVGRFKARVFAAAGFTEATLDEFVAEVRRVAAEGDLSQVEDTTFGRKYTVSGVLSGPAGAIQVLTVWIEEPGQRGVRLVTVQPR